MLPGDIVLSATIDDETGFVNALIHGCDKEDVVTLSHWLKVLTPDVFHPLLLPALVMELIKIKHAAKIEERSEKILELSGASRQYDMSPKVPLDHVENYNTLTKEAYQLHQDAGDLFIACAQTKVHIKRLLKLAREAEKTCNSKPHLADAPRLIQQLEDIMEAYDHLERTCVQVTQDSNLLMGAVSSAPQFLSLALSHTF